MAEKKIRQGSRLLFNPLPSSFPPDLQESLHNAISEVTGISDAYLARCSLPYEREPRLVLVVGIGKDVSQQAVAHRLMDLLDDVRWEDKSVDVLPFNTGSVPPAVLQTGRKIV